MEKSSKGQIFFNGLTRQNPILVLSVALVSTLAATTSVFNGLALGVSAAIILLLSELVLSVFKKIIPSDALLPISVIVLDRKSVV